MLRGGLHQGLVKGRRNEGNKKKGKKEDAAYPLSSKAAVAAAAEAEWSLEPWAMLSLSSICIFLSLPPLCLSWLPQSVCLIPLS